MTNNEKITMLVQQKQTKKFSTKFYNYNWDCKTFKSERDSKKTLKMKQVDQIRI